MRSVPPNGKLPELVCEFFFVLEWEAEASSPSGARSGARARSDFPPPCAPRFEILRSGWPGGGVFSEIFAFPATQKW